MFAHSYVCNNPLRTYWFHPPTSFIIYVSYFDQYSYVNNAKFWEFISICITYKTDQPDFYILGIVFLPQIIELSITINNYALFALKYIITT